MLTPQDLRHRLVRANAARRHRHTGIPRFVQELLQKDAHRYQYTATPQNPPSFTYGADFETRYSTPINRNYTVKNVDNSSIISKTWKKLRKHRFGRRSSSSTKSSRRAPPSDLMRLFGETSLPGFRDIALSRSYIRRIFWIAAFFFFSLWALRDISQLISEYFEHPITVKVRLRENRQIQFPSVTVCNLNIVRFSALCMKNVSKIHHRMIPDDLRTKLCGTAPPVVKSLVNFTMAPSILSAETPSVDVRKKKKTASKEIINEVLSEDINSYGDRASCNCTGNSTIHTVNEIENKRKKRDMSDRSTIGNILNAFGMMNNSTNVENNDQLEITEREEKELQENLTNWLAVIQHSNPPIAKHLGHQFEDFLLHCTFRFMNCTDSTRFEHIFTPTEGNCFTFKPKLSKRRQRKQRLQGETSIAGNRYGLELVLNFEIDEYLTGSTQIGAMVMVQHPDEIGLSASEAIFVEPQQSTYIGLRMNNISRLPAPFPDECVNQWPDALVGKLTHNTSYSQQRCLKICLQRAIFSHCNCQSAMLPLLELNSTLKICDTRHRMIRDCVDHILYIAEERFGNCQCPARCQVINYDKTVSTTRWPTREDKITFDRKRSVSFQNLAKVTIYFQTMTCQEVIQERAYTTARLCSALGGILGMYVGFSFLSILEIFEVLFRRFWYALRHRNQTNKQKNQEQQQNSQQQQQQQYSQHNQTQSNYYQNYRSTYYDQNYNRNNRRQSFRSIVHAVVDRLKINSKNNQNGRF